MRRDNFAFVVPCLAIGLFIEGCVAPPGSDPTQDADLDSEAVIPDDSASICIGAQPSVLGCLQSFHTVTTNDHSFPFTGCPGSHVDALGIVFTVGVLGKLNDVKKYMGCPGYATLSVPDSQYSHDLNRQWMYCVANGLIFDDPGLNSGTTNLSQFQEVSAVPKDNSNYAQEDCYLHRSKNANPPGVGARSAGGGLFLSWQQ